MRRLITLLAVGVFVLLGSALLFGVSRSPDQFEFLAGHVPSEAGIHEVKKGRHAEFRTYFWDERFDELRPVAQQELTSKGFTETDTGNPLIAAWVNKSAGTAVVISATTAPLTIAKSRVRYGPSWVKVFTSHAVRIGLFNQLRLILRRAFHLDPPA